MSGNRRPALQDGDPEIKLSSHLLPSSSLPACLPLSGIFSFHLSPFRVPSDICFLKPFSFFFFLTTYLNPKHQFWVNILRYKKKEYLLFQRYIFLIFVQIYFAYLYKISDISDIVRHRIGSGFMSAVEENSSWSSRSGKCQKNPSEMSPITERRGQRLTKVSYVFPFSVCRCYTFPVFAH